MSKQFESIRIEEHTRKQFVEIRTQTQLTSTELLTQMMGKYLNKKESQAHDEDRYMPDLKRTDYERNTDN